MDSQKELIAEFDREMAKTRKILDAIPADADWSFKPHAKSMSLGRLAGHLTDFVGDWGNHTLTMDKLEFAADHKWEPYAPTSKAELLERFDKKLAETRPVLVATTGEHGTGTGSLCSAGRPGSTTPNTTCSAKPF